MTQDSFVVSRRAMLAGAGAGALGALLARSRASAALLAQSWRGGDPRDLIDLSDGVIYLNTGSIAPTPRPIRELHAQLTLERETNPWRYIWNDGWEERGAEARATIGAYMGCDASEVAVTRNTNEGAHILARGIDLRDGDEILLPSFNHFSANECWDFIAQRCACRETKVNTAPFPYEDAPSMTADDVVEYYRSHVTPRTRVVSFPHVDNIVGLRHPIKPITDALRAEGVDFVFVDGAQAVGLVPWNLRETGIDAYFGSAYKWMQAPVGTGFMYVPQRRYEDILPLWSTFRFNDTSRRYETPTSRDTSRPIVFAECVKFHEALGWEAREGRHKKLWRRAMERADASKKVKWKSPRSWDLATPLFGVEVVGKNQNAVAQTIRERRGIEVRAFQLRDYKGLRVCPHIFNTIEEIDTLFDELELA